MDRAPTKKIDDIVAFVLQSSRIQMQQNASQAARQYESTVDILLIVIALSAVVSIIATYWIITGITGPLRDAVRRYAFNQTPLEKMHGGMIVIA
jgi:methyl-accepting chemotaxis protein-1 (serine sensor receptor)